jgi:hypothetical protein
LTAIALPKSWRFGKTEGIINQVKVDVTLNRDISSQYAISRGRNAAAQQRHRVQFVCTGFVTETTKDVLMTQAAEELKTQLAKLPDDDREALAYFLISTLPEDDDRDDAWEAELTRRDAELDSGRAREIPASEVMKRLREQR